MFKQLKEIFEEELAVSYCSEKKLEKCVSATDISSFRTKNLITPQFIQAITPQLKAQRSRQSDEFLFCLKLKMIGIAGIFGHSEFDSEKIQSQDANEILNMLARKIKAFQKQSNRRLNEQINKNKLLEIKIIQLESLIKSLESQQAHSQKQIEKNTKYFSIDFKKIERKAQEIESQKELISIKLRSANQIVDQQAKCITQLQVKVAELTKNKKNLQTSMFDKQKIIAKLTNDQKLTQIKHSQQCEGLKKSLMRNSEQVNKLNAEIKNLKQIIQNKQKKNEEFRLNYNKLYHQLGQSQSKLNMMTQQHNALVEKMKNQYQINMKRFQQKHQGLAKSLSQIEETLGLKISSIRIFSEQVDKIRIKQHHIQTEVYWLLGEMKNFYIAFEEKYQRQQLLLKEQNQIETRTAVLNVEQFYKQQLAKLQDQIFRLKCLPKSQ